MADGQTGSDTVMVVVGHSAEQPEEEEDLIVVNTVLHSVTETPAYLIAPPGKVPIIEIAYPNDKWWSISPETSRDMVDARLRNEPAIYVYDWRKERKGSWETDDQDKNYSRYELHLDEGIQINMDNQRRRDLRLLWVDPASARAEYTGEIPRCWPLDTSMVVTGHSAGQPDGRDLMIVDTGLDSLTKTPACMVAPPGKVPIIEVAYPNSMWWQMSRRNSQDMVDACLQNKRARYEWDWGNQRSGSYQVEGKATSYSRYEMDFDKRLHINMDNKRCRSLRLLWLDPASMTAEYTGTLQKFRPLQAP